MFGQNASYAWILDSLQLCAQFHVLWPCQTGPDLLQVQIHTAGQYDAENSLVTISLLVFNEDKPIGDGLPGQMILRLCAVCLNLSGASMSLSLVLCRVSATSNSTIVSPSVNDGRHLTVNWVAMPNFYSTESPCCDFKLLRAV